MISMLMSLPAQFWMHNKAKAIHETVKVTQQQQICQALSSSVLEFIPHIAVLDLCIAVNRKQ